MKTSRRTFLKSGAMVALGAAILPRAIFASGSLKQKGMVGIQLYSIRDDMMKDPKGSLTQLAKMGYVYVEHANYVDQKFYGFLAPEFRKMLDGLGLKMISGHTVMGKQHWDETKKDFSDSWKKTVEDAAVLGQKWVISPWMDETMRKTYDDFKRYMDVFNKCGELCKKSGMQLDIGNLYNGGAIALDVMNQYPGRFEIMHVKDEIPAKTGTEKYESTSLGEGIVNTKKVVELGAKKGGTRCYIIEQESYGEKTPMYCAK